MKNCSPNLTYLSESANYNLKSATIIKPEHCGFSLEKKNS